MGFFCTLRSLAVASLVLLLSCSSSDDNGLEINSVNPNRTFFLPGNITFEDDTCYDDGEISEPRFQIDELVTSWRGEGSFQPIILRVTFNAVGENIADYECTISGRSDSSLGVFLGYSGTSVAGGAADNVTSSCPIHCGSVSITNEDVVFGVNAQIKLIGIQTKTDGTQLPASVISSVFIQNIQ